MAQFKQKVRDVLSQEIGADAASDHESNIDQLLTDQPNVEAHLTPREAAEQVICGTA